MFRERITAFTGPVAALRIGIVLPGDQPRLQPGPNGVSSARRLTRAGFELVLHHRRQPVLEAGELGVEVIFEE